MLSTDRGSSSTLMRMTPSPSPSTKDAVARLVTMSITEHRPEGIGRLPSEVLARIYSSLSQSSDKLSFMLTNWLWYHVAVDDIWKRPDILDEEVLTGICSTLKSPNPTRNYAQLIRRLNLTQVRSSVTDYVLECFADCNRLERLVLYGATSLSAKVVEDMLIRNPFLISVDLCNLSTITDLTMAKMSFRCPRIQGLYISGCYNITDLGVASIGRNLSALRRVRLSDCKGVTGTSLSLLVCRCPEIVELDVSLADPYSEGTLSDAALSHLISRLPLLRELRLVGQTQLSNDAFEPQCTPGYCLPDTLSGSWLQNLRLVDLTSCIYISDVTVKRLVEAAPRLHHVSLGRCYRVTDAGLLSLAMLGYSLHFLHLGHCPHITDAGVEQIVRFCPRLQYIDLANCGLITNVSLFHLASLPKLRRIGLVKCMLVGDRGIDNISNRRWPDDPLERIHLSYCGLITERGVLGLLNACPRLMHLSLTGVQSFVRPEITKFCRTPPHDLNEHQRSIFCVFSGSGVTRLRDYLRKTLA